MFTYAPVDCKSISGYEATNGFTMDNSYVALDVDMWCPDVVLVVSYWCVCVCSWGWGALVGGGGACVSRDASELQ